MKGNKGIGVRLYALIGFVIVFIITISSFTWYKFKNFDEKSKIRLESTIKYINLVDHSRQAQVHFKIQVQEWKNILLRGNDPKSFDKYYSQFTEEYENVQSRISNIKINMSKSGMDTSLVDTLLSDHKYLYDKYTKAIQGYDKKNPQSYKIVDTMVKGMDRSPTQNMDKLVSYIDDKAKSETEKMVKEANEDTSEFNKSLVVMTTGGIILIIFFAILITLTYRGITKFIDQFNLLMEKAEDGDLTIKGEIYKKDELGQITERFNRFIDRVRDLISEAKKTSEVVAASSSEIMEATDRVSAASEEVATTISNIANGASRQVELAEESSSSVKGVVEGLNHISENTIYIDELASSAMEIVNNGTISIKDQSEKMSTTKNASEDVTNVISELSKKSKEIGTVVEFINGITEQINLLSLNASIEAARAGEAGRGFTVVANEVKKLAELSKESTLKISNLIEEVQIDIEKAVNGVSDTKTSIDEQEASLKIIDDSFNLIRESVFDVASKIKEVANETKIINENAISAEKFLENIVGIIEQSALGTEEVASTTEEQTASIQEVASSMSNLVELSNNLEVSISKFKV
ncbi:methyl-accepting chemotaxis protein [Clostridium cylindrosporum]|uniref:Methyl-accepting chemotaxis protein TlpA n=1 Tax=Clostridium cylindrosporum DSM 605 TaxID=1121307 RepID=A0A0J8DBR7_CLOCY|nr:methyl-accepting chemotaxis protein [Clostridium cylindrosporum]KMT21754.1 methyl-accepting chemotaxis protein TlpA [Clostridium cylindrosporum DSM 605]